MLIKEQTGTKSNSPETDNLIITKNKTERAFDS